MGSATAKLIPLHIILLGPVDLAYLVQEGPVFAWRSFCQVLPRAASERGTRSAINGRPVVFLQQLCLNARMLIHSADTSPVIYGYVANNTTQIFRRQAALILWSEFTCLKTREPLFGSFSSREMREGIPWSVRIDMLFRVRRTAGSVSNTRTPHQTTKTVKGMTSLDFTSSHLLSSVCFIQDRSLGFTHT
ncbi:hypothetical protein BKA67DRAFT_564183 [Truncatella angustata]|uniref:Secreted protein n=1 Tax=Truncatella angustata TaxID=152316 RepID=A0A9P8ULE2_9PEZI|nr:uncharacterized protein BKA67DRAFT_564183 [Truncatella angustata]KAH6654112.1 hypothetical protein BKA67DRAFT_564183 [Truncatella angustata]